MYALYSKNKPQSDALLSSHGNEFFKVRLETAVTSQPHTHTNTHTLLPMLSVTRSHKHRRKKDYGRNYCGKICSVKR